MYFIRSILDHERPIKKPKSAATLSGFIINRLNGYQLMSNSTVAQDTLAAHHAVFTIHTDVITDWRRKVRDVQLIAREFSSQIEALATLERVRKTNPKAFIKTRVIH